MFTMRMAYYMGIPTSSVSVFKLGRLFGAVPTADAIATGKVNCYAFII